MSPPQDIGDQALLGSAQPSGASVTWEDDFTSDNWTSSSGANYVDTTNNKLIRGNDASIWTLLDFTPQATSTGKFVVTYGYEIITLGWASQAHWGLATHSAHKYNNLSDDNEMTTFLGNDWEASGGMSINTRAKYSGSLNSTASTGNSSIASTGVITYCKTVFDGASSDKIKTYFYSDADMETPLTIGSANFRVNYNLPSNWADDETTWYLWASGYASYGSATNIYPIKFYNGVNEI